MGTTRTFSRHFQDSKYVCEKNVFFGGRWSDFPTKLLLLTMHVKNLVTRYADVFKDSIGCMPGEYEIKLDETRQLQSLVTVREVTSIETRQTGVFFVFLGLV